MSSFNLGEGHYTLLVPPKFRQTKEPRTPYRRFLKYV